MPKKKTKKKKEELDKLNIVEAMQELPNMDLLRIALTGVAILHDRAMKEKLDEDANKIIETAT